MNYETQDASLRVIGVSTALLAFLVVFAIVTSTWLYHATYTGSNALPTSGRAGSFTHGPDERKGIDRDYAEVMRQAADHLHSYGWVDEKAGIARIPIERAMELIAAGAKPAPAPKPPGQTP
jgi:hypothetical protein